MSKIQALIDGLGGRTNVAQQLGLPYTTVLGWCVHNQVPEWRQSALLDLAERNGTPLDPSEFPTKAERIARKASA